MKIGLVLGGGGSKGPYQLGVLEALLEDKMLNELKVISGASIGSINASLVVGKQTIDEMKDFWSNINNENVYKLSNNKRDRVFDQTIMYNNLIKFQDAKIIKESEINFYASVSRTVSNALRDQINRNSMVNEMILLNEHEEPHKVILASSSIPVVFGPTMLDNKYYLDGGLTNNLPIEVLIQEDCDVIVVVGLNPDYNLKQFSANNLIIDYSPTNSLTRTFIGSLNFSDNEEYYNIGYENAKHINNYLKNRKIYKNNKFNNETKGIISLEEKEEIKKVSHYL